MDRSWSPALPRVRHRGHVACVGVDCHELAHAHAVRPLGDVVPSLLQVLRDVGRAGDAQTADELVLLHVDGVWQQLRVQSRGHHCLEDVVPPADSVQDHLRRSSDYSRPSTGAAHEAHAGVGVDQNARGHGAERALARPR